MCVCVHTYTLMHACIHIFLQHLIGVLLLGFFFQCCGGRGLVAVPYITGRNNGHMYQALPPL